MSVAMADNGLSANAPTERTLNDLLNLALRTPEVGAVNFNILHTLLNTILEKLNLQDVLTELPTTQATAEPQSVKVDSTQNTDGWDKKLSALESKVNTLVEEAQKERPPSVDDLSHKVVNLEKQLEVLTSPPSNQSLIEKSRSGSSKAPATEVWQQMQLQKRVEANEGGVSKALSLIDDLMREMNRLVEEQKKMKADMERISKRLEQASDMSAILDRLTAVEAYKTDINQLRDDVDALMTKLSAYPDASEFDSFITWPVLEEALTQHMAKMEEMRMRKEEEEAAAESGPSTPQRTPIPSRPTSSRLSSAKERFPQATEMLEQIGALNDRHNVLDGRVCVLEDTMPTKQDKLNLDELLNSRKDTSIPDDLLEQLAALREAIDALERERQQEEGLISGLQNAILNLQAELERLRGLIQAAMDEHEAKQKHIDSLYGYVEKLEEVKADKELVKMEVDVKADKRALANKVNRTDFDHTTGEMGKNIDDLLKKILNQEEEWQKTAKQISADVDLKLDRGELDALRQSLENRLKALKKLLDQRSPAREITDDDAAGFRKQLIKNYHCISCDRPVDLMPAGPIPSIPANSALPASKTVRPYTSFELDQLRQQARGEGTDFDAVVPTGRPCGGSYTLTFPHRRYTRLTHLSDIWQQEEEEEAMVEVTKEEVELQGQDGHIYRGRLPHISPSLPDRRRPHTTGLALSPNSSPRPSSARHGRRSVQPVRRPLSSGGERSQPPHLLPDQNAPRIAASVGGQ